MELIAPPALRAADLELRRAFESRTLAAGGFHHREHVRLTWGYLTERGPDDVAALLCEALRALAADHGAPERYHHTLTVAWVRLVASARQRQPALDFDALVAACPYLLDKDTPLAFYRRERLYSDAARQHWVEPDIRPLPALA